MNMFASVLIAYVVLVATTHNVLVPLFAVLSIANTMIWTLAAVFLAGYQFNRAHTRRPRRAFAPHAIRGPRTRRTLVHHC